MHALCVPGSMHHYESFVAAAIAEGLSLSLSQLRDHMSQKGAVFTVATHQEQAIAWLLGQLQPPDVEIFDLVVLPAHRRKGVASLLLRSLVTQLSHRPEGIFVEVAADNPGARALYQKVGFERVGLRKNYYPRPHGDPATNVDAWVLRWSPP